MKVTVKLYASLRDYLPDAALNHRIELEVAPGTTPNDIIDSLHVPKEQAHLCLLNGTYLAPSERDQSRLEAGDTLALWPPVAGGAD